MDVGGEIEADGCCRYGVLRYRVDACGQAVCGVDGEEHDSRSGVRAVGNGQFHTDATRLRRSGMEGQSPIRTGGDVGVAAIMRRRRQQRQRIAIRVGERFQGVHGVGRILLHRNIGGHFDLLRRAIAGRVDDVQPCRGGGGPAMPVRNIVGEPYGAVARFGGIDLQIPSVKHRCDAGRSTGRRAHTVDAHCRAACAFVVAQHVDRHTARRPDAELVIHGADMTGARGLRSAIRGEGIAVARR